MKEKRINDINFDGILYTLKEAVEDFSSFVEENPREVNIKGVVIVGTALTEDFKEGESDLDLYIILEDNYDNSEGFIRFVNDKSSYYYKTIEKNIPDKFREVDFIDTITEKRISNVMRDPYLIKIRK